MHVIAYCPATGEEYLNRLLDDEELLDAEAFAEKIAADMDASLSPETGYVPSCCGDIRVEFREDPDNACVIWSGESFYLDF